MSDYSEAEQWERAKEWARTNGLWIVAGVALGAGGLGGWNWYKDRRVAQAESASARYEEMIEAFTRNDRTRGMTLVEDLNREYSWTPYASLASLMAARVQVEANELDKAATSLKTVMDSAPDDELRLIARTAPGARAEPRRASTTTRSPRSRSISPANSRRASPMRAVTCCSPRAIAPARCVNTWRRAPAKRRAASTPNCWT